MPLKRQLFEVGGSKAVTLPKSWIETAEESEGKRVIAISMEVNGCLILAPIFEKSKASVTASQANHASPNEPLSNLKGKERVVIDN